MANNLRVLLENSIKEILLFDVKVESNQNTTEIYIFNEDEVILRKESWEIIVTVLDNQLLFEFTFNNSAKRMQELYLKSLDQSYKQMNILIENITKIGWNIRIISNGLDLDKLDTNLVGTISIKAKKVFLDSSSLNNDKITSEALLFTSLVLTPLVPTDDSVNPLVEHEGMPEGSLTQVLVNKYERSPKNRAICISYHGAICAGCEFSFETFYGDFAKGYIHVHHITPISKLGSNYIIDPIKDLIPLCPNCHNAIHVVSPPLSVFELKKKINENKQWQ